MVFFGQLTVFLSLDLFCCYGCRACFFGTSQHITCSQSVFASVVPHQDQPIFPCQLWKNPSVLEPQRWCQQWQQNLLRKQKPPQTPGRICERSLFVPTIIFSGSYHMEGDGDKTCYCYPSQARLTRRSWVCDENFSSPWDQSCRSRKTDTDCWVTGSGLRYWVAAATTLWHRWLRGLLCMSCMASTPYLYSKHKAIFSVVSKLRCITWPPYFTLLSCRVFGCSSSWDWG